MVAQRAGNKAEQHVAQMGFWDQLATWIGANANNGTWYMGGVLAALGFAGALGVILISGPLAYLFLALVGYMGYKMRASTMNLMIWRGVRNCPTSPWAPVIDSSYS